MKKRKTLPGSAGAASKQSINGNSVRDFLRETARECRARLLVDYPDGVPQSLQRQIRRKATSGRSGKIFPAGGWATPDDHRRMRIVVLERALRKSATLTDSDLHLMFALFSAVAEEGIAESIAEEIEKKSRRERKKKKASVDEFADALVCAMRTELGGARPRAKEIIHQASLGPERSELVARVYRRLKHLSNAIKPPHVVVAKWGVRHAQNFLSGYPRKHISKTSYPELVTEALEELGTKRSKSVKPPS